MSIFDININSKTTELVRNDKKRKCTNCRKKIVDGAQVLIFKSEKGKIRGYFCSDLCLKGWT